MLEYLGTILWDPLQGSHSVPNSSIIFASILSVVGDAKATKSESPSLGSVFLGLGTVVLITLQSVFVRDEDCLQCHKNPKCTKPWENLGAKN